MGYLLVGGEADIRKTEEYLLRSFTDGKFGRITFDQLPSFSPPPGLVKIHWSDEKINFDDSI